MMVVHITINVAIRQKIKKACYKWCKEKGNRTCDREWRKVVFNDESKKEDGK